jgi:ubiquinone/menaquinone biosynthesis C-methylase UbiE
MQASELAQAHWNETPLFISEEERYGTYPWLPEAAEFALHRDEKVLEIGCGTGCDLLQFVKHGAIASGIDITEEHLRLARQRLAGKTDIRLADARNIPFPDNSFDYVYSHGVLHHSDEPEKIVWEIMRVLRPGGRFNIHVYARYSYFTLYRMLQYGRDWKLHIENSESPVHIDLYTARSLQKLFPVPITVTKHQAKPVELLAPILGWYLVAKGAKSE